MRVHRSHRAPACDYRCGHCHRVFNAFTGTILHGTKRRPRELVLIVRGFAQGVHPNMGVIGPQGIVGSVINVSENYATVMSLLHRQFKVVAKLKNGREAGPIDWDGLSPLFVTLRAIPRSAKVAVGDSVVTSQTSSLFPANIMVGTVYEIVPDNTSNFYTLKIRPATNFFNIEYAYVIDNLQYNEQKKLEDSTRKKVQ